jgi:hypothetical protein
MPGSTLRGGPPRNYHDCLTNAAALILSMSWHPKYQVARLSSLRPIAEPPLRPITPTRDLIFRGKFVDGILLHDYQTTSDVCKTHPSQNGRARIGFKLGNFTT